MAVYAAHLTRTLQGTPTIFQVTAQEALGATVKPALRKVVEVSLLLLFHNMILIINDVQLASKTASFLLLVHTLVVFT